MSWSYRMVRNGDGMVGIKEIYWRESASNISADDLTYDHVRCWTEGFMYPFGDGQGEFREDFKKMTRALSRPILDEVTMVKSVEKNKDEIKKESEEDIEEFEL